MTYSDAQLEELADRVYKLIEEYYGPDWYSREQVLVQLQHIRAIQDKEDKKRQQS